MSGLGRDWWRDAVIYEVYVRSFADADGDGVGDLAGLRERLDHLAGLGVDAVWITPFYPSPGHDHGYDVADYRDVDPALGSLAGFDALVADAHRLGLRVMVDLVPNHTSIEHPWFVAARASGDSPMRDRYVWRPPRSDGSPPNNWAAAFGGPAWTLDQATGEYWLHLFLPEQPDLNWRDPGVAEAFREILDFWVARGVDGFRVDVAHALIKREGLPDNPPSDDRAWATRPGGRVGRVSTARRLARVNDIDQPEVLDIYRDWRRHLGGRDVLLLGETVLDDPARLTRYVAGGDGLHSVMWFGGLTVPFDAAAVAEVLAAVAHAPPGGLSWCLSNHDRQRPASRFGGGAAGAERSLAVAALLLAMPGPYLLYQGEELGCEDLVLAGGWQDPIAVRGGEPEAGRDRARAPLPWSPGPGGGFTGGTPWLPPSPVPADGTVAEQRRDPGSLLARWTALLETWRALRGRLPGEVAVCRSDDLVTVERGPLVARLNCGPGPAQLAAPAGVAWRSARRGRPELVEPGETVWALAPAAGDGG